MSCVVSEVSQGKNDALLAVAGGWLRLTQLTCENHEDMETEKWF